MDRLLKSPQRVRRILPSPRNSSVVRCTTAHPPVTAFATTFPLVSARALTVPCSPRRVRPPALCGMPHGPDGGNGRLNSGGGAAAAAAAVPSGTATRASHPPRLNRVLSDATRAALAARRRGIIESPETRKKMVATAARNRRARGAAVAAALAKRAGGALRRAASDAAASAAHAASVAIGFDPRTAMLLANEHWQNQYANGSPKPAIPDAAGASNYGDTVPTISDKDSESNIGDESQKHPDLHQPGDKSSDTPLRLTSQLSTTANSKVQHIRAIVKKEDNLTIAHESPGNGNAITAASSSRRKRRRGRSPRSAHSTSPELPTVTATGEAASETTRQYKTKVGAKISRALKGRKLSEERKQKISAALKGRKLTEDHKRKLRERFAGSQNPMYGRKLSAESRSKISNAIIASTARRRRNTGSDVEDEQVLPSQSEADGEKHEPLHPQVKAAVMRSRLVESLQRKSKDRDVEVAMEELLARVAAGELPPVAVERMRAAIQREREANYRRSSSSVGGDRKMKLSGSRPEEISHEANLGNGKSKTRADTVEGAEAHTSTDEVYVQLPADAGNDRDRSPTLTQFRKKRRRRTLSKSVIENKSTQCSCCAGQGVIPCPSCIGKFGFGSRQCDLCLGAASVFCPTCEGSGLPS